MNHQSPELILRETFGYESFRLEQKNIIESVLDGLDTLAIMPTGGGKSLCYQIPAIVNPGLTLVMSPLIALMKDQVDALKLVGIEAAYLNSSQTNSQQLEVFTALKEGKLKLLYLAPERLFDDNNYLVGLLQQLEVSLVAVDEAHCISSWGHDFRPVYLKLARFKKIFPGKPVLALTATADKLTQKDIIEKLGLESYKIFVSSFNRKNLRYQVVPKNNSFKQLTHFLIKHREESGIIYCLSREGTERVAERLNETGQEAAAYHAGLTTAVRNNIQERFIKDELKIVVATIAFGMGIDKSNVRYVVHMDLPKNIESYYQETGRAGRDGLDSECILFFSYGDVYKLRNFITSDEDEEHANIQKKKLDQMAEFGSLSSCRRSYLLNYFGEEFQNECGNCDNCLHKKETFDATQIAQMALSAVARLKENFGMNLVIDFLRGSKSEKIRAYMRELPTYGVGQEYSKKDWIHYFQEIIRQGYLNKTDDQYPILLLNSKSWKILKGEEKIFLTKPVTVEFSSQESSEDLYEKLLFEQLRAWRRDEAARRNIPPYMIFSDASLREVCTYLPLLSNDLALINGFGKIKIENFGSMILEIVRSYCLERELPSRMHLKPGLAQRSPVRRNISGSKTTEVTYDLWKKGISLADIASQRALNLATVEGHLNEYIANGDIKIDALVKKSDREAIQKQIDLHGISSLKTLKTNLPEEYSYSMIRWVLSANRAN